MFPPLTYSVTGCCMFPSRFPISMWPMQWFTPIIGFCSASESVRAAVAIVRRHGPRPGPCAKLIRSMSFSVSCASCSACVMSCGIFWLWCSAASLGCIPPFWGISCACCEASIFPWWFTMPIPVFSAVPSIPSDIIIYCVCFFCVSLVLYIMSCVF